MAWLAALMTTLGLVGLFRRRFFLDPVGEGGLHWRAALLQFAKWPYQCIAAWRAFWRMKAAYTVTLKVRSSTSRSLLLWPHWVVMVLMAEAVTTAISLDLPLTTPVFLGAVGTLVMSTGLAFSEFVPSPPAWDGTLYQRTRARLAGLLGPAHESREEEPFPPGEEA